MTSKREAILDAYRDEIAEHGISTVTLESVAARAGVSKGGLLYHFPSKQALTDALAQRLRDYTDANLALADTRGTARAFLQTSRPATAEAQHYWAVITAVQSDTAAVSEHTRQIVHDVFADWSVRLKADISDPVLADIIRLVGDGLYLAAVTGLPALPARRANRVINHLIAAAETSDH
ncbi:TetR family transcriptional regulator [Nocardioides sp. InS609-2]|uniref:TetR/AcrR family transcriptional regulator n=1 Tax=Nocardioides sp. InS609-2 TaxID=2760705 RepID=UPI0020C11088|nr:TetR family transcriptional regulator [Nocardioides sp. InS609-2]